MKIVLGLLIVIFLLLFGFLYYHISNENADELILILREEADRETPTKPDKGGDEFKNRWSPLLEKRRKENEANESDSLVNFCLPSADGECRS